MHIVVLTNILTPYRLPLFDALQSQVETLTVVVQATGHEDRSWDVSDASFPVHVLSGWHWRPAGHDVSLHLNRGVGRLLRRLRPDVVISGGFGPANLAAFTFCQRKGIPHVAWGELLLDDNAQHSLLRRVLRRLICSRSAACLASSSRSAEAFRHYGADPQRVVTALMPLDVAGFARHAAEVDPGGQNELLFTAGRLVDVKGYRQLLRAFSRLLKHHPNARLCCAGDGAARKDYECLVDKLGLAGRVEFVGLLSPAQLAYYYRSALAFVFPTLWDPYGAVLGEALASGAVALASVHAAATGDLLDDGCNGFVFDPCSDDDFDAVLHRAFALSKSQSRAIRERAQETSALLDCTAGAATMKRVCEALVEQRSDLGAVPANVDSSKNLTRAS